MTENGFQKANSGNLPRVDTLMVASFFSSNEKFIGAELKGVKNSRAGRESYGDDAVGYVQVQRSGNICTVKARVTPEHKIRSKCYTAQVQIDEKNSMVKSIECFDCAASTGGCKHAIALLMWVHRRSEDPAPTSVECYWKKSRLSQVGTSLKFVLAEDMAPKPSSNRNTSLSPPGSFLSKVIEEGARSKCQGQLFEHFKSVKDHEFLLLHNIAFWHVKNGGCSLDEFFLQCNFNMTESRCKEVAQLTALQCKESLWHELRFGRITASKVHEAAHCKTTNGTLVETILGAKLKDNKFMKRGRDLEPIVLQVVETMVGKKFQKIGILLNANYPIIGASPDAICDDYIVEVKCPCSLVAVQKYFSKGTVTPKVMAQMQLQMLMSGKREGLLCIADIDFENNKRVELHQVKYNAPYIEKLVNDAMKFWEKAIFPKLIEIK